MKITVSTPVYNSFRVQQVSGIFDVALESKLTQTFDVPTPDLASGEWRIGLIVGPSGSGKSTVARHLFGDRLYQTGTWPEDAAVLDGFDPGLPIRTITGLLTTVGFSSPPSWVKPYHVLSNGERFRCDLARALAGTQSDAQSEVSASGEPGEIVAFDEFTSVVDRTVAHVASAAVSKAIRSGAVKRRLVAVTCHYDVAEWLEPDWILDMASGTLSRRRLRRPNIELSVIRCRNSAWALFARHHYLSGQLSPSARCFMALWNDVPVAFCGILPLICRKKHFRISRLVTLPDFQGLGIGLRFAETVAELYREQGRRMSITGSHPSVIGHCRKSALWRTVSVNNVKSRPRTNTLGEYRGAYDRATVSFEYVGRGASAPAGSRFSRPAAPRPSWEVPPTPYGTEPHDQKKPTINQEAEG